MHVPFFLRWPGHVASSTTYPLPVARVDIYATAAAATGARLPTNCVMDGVDLMPFLSGRNEGSPHENLFWRSGNYRVVLKDGWKLQFLKQPHEVFFSTCTPIQPSTMIWPRPIPASKMLYWH